MNSTFKLEKDITIQQKKLIKVAEALSPLGWVPTPKGWRLYVHPVKPYTISVIQLSEGRGTVLTARFNPVICPRKGEVPARDLGFDILQTTVDVGKKNLAENIRKRLLRPMDNDIPDYEAKVREFTDRRERFKENLNRLSQAICGHAPNEECVRQEVTPRGQWPEGREVQAGVKTYAPDAVKVEFCGLSVDEALDLIAVAKTFRRHPDNLTT